MRQNILLCLENGHRQIFQDNWKVNISLKQVSNNFPVSAEKNAKSYWLSYKILGAQSTTTVFQNPAKDSLLLSIRLKTLIKSSLKSIYCVSIVLNGFPTQNSWKLDQLHSEPIRKPKKDRVALRACWWRLPQKKLLKASKILITMRNDKITEIAKEDRLICAHGD